MPDSRQNLLDLPPARAAEVVAAFLSARGEPAYRAAQIVDWLWQKPVADFDGMSNLPKRLRDQLAEAFSLPRLELMTQQQSQDGTRKFLFRLHDGQAIETVAIPDGDRMTLCISSQAGCALKCAFCATGAMGFQRNLQPFEIAGQVRELALLADRPITATNIVFMGMGEPLMNWPAVDVTLSILNAPTGFGIGARHITISTVGVLPGIIALSARPEQFRLAISIHAPTDELRGTLMPVNIKFPLRQVIDAAREFDRRVTFEYVMLGGVNDKPVHADQLAALAKDCRAFVNLIPLHPGGSMGFTPSTVEAMQAFKRRVSAEGVEVAIRRSRGLDIAAACGQLRVERIGRRAPRTAEPDGQVHVA
jgi:23S rRNA (adenine2503-C2)-methyltransferase